MIELRTGQPGAGKTLFCLADIRARADKEKRAVYYSGISELAIPGWTELEDPTKWPTLPDGSIIVIDEAQRVFRPRHTSSGVPEHVSALETHRHRGFDVVLVTQHPKLVDTNIRRLVGRHLHVMRAFGTKNAVIHEWNECKPDPDLTRSDSLTATRAYPTEVFTWYKSAEIHTHKSRVPMRVWMLFLAPLLLIGTAFLLYKWIQHRTGADAGKTTSTLATSSKGTPTPGATVTALTPRQYIDIRQPRIAGLAYTAPVYDEITKPSVAPYPAACASMGTRCSCYTQQGTQLDVPKSLCEQIVDRGFFKEWEDKAAQQMPGKASERPQVAFKSDPVPMQPPQPTNAATTISQDLTNTNRGSAK